MSKIWLSWIPKNVNPASIPVQLRNDICLSRVLVQFFQFNEIKVSTFSTKFDFQIKRPISYELYYYSQIEENPRKIILVNTLSKNHWMTILNDDQAIFARRKPILPSFLSLVTITKVLRYFEVIKNFSQRIIYYSEPC